ncbi:hypothetical protein FIBSPDRAFT_849690 [Athelia psychrophila]|uniref:Uncharacterized protein n=1 Tax=Athelia psychrophila TaxID=1759441 RepID=A0A166U0K9_9AGAM|nr:hypothetical protein FIBSPDRAFT_849690 [Fibularhizoctonia sp. CBS 109695]
MRRLAGEYRRFLLRLHLPLARLLRCQCRDGLRRPWVANSRRFQANGHIPRWLAPEIRSGCDKYVPSRGLRLQSPSALRQMCVLGLSACC